MVDYWLRKQGWLLDYSLVLLSISSSFNLTDTDTEKKI